MMLVHDVMPCSKSISFFLFSLWLLPVICDRCLVNLNEGDADYS